MADEGKRDARQGDELEVTGADSTIRAKPLSDRDTIPEFAAQRRPSWEPVPPRRLALSERKWEPPTEK